jgi:uncharacterized protein (DUF924 family)
MAVSPDEIHAFWFGELDEHGKCAAEHNSLWFASSTETDETCRTRFGQGLEQALAGDLDNWVDTHEGLVALIILLDQFSRNIGRSTPSAFAGDPKALALAQEAIATGRNMQLPLVHRVFLYLPLEHCENLEVQENCVALFTELAAQAKDPSFDGFTRYAVAHRDVIAQFGRFPHRNEILGRTSSAAELLYLEKHGGF